MKRVILASLIALLILLPVFGEEKDKRNHIRGGFEFTEVVLARTDLSLKVLYDSLVVSPNLTRAAYVDCKRGKEWVVLDGIRQPEYDEIGVGSLVFSPDGSRFAYAASRERRQFIVVDGKEQKEYKAVFPDSITFGGDGARIAYTARSEANLVTVVDGEELNTEGAVGWHAVFSQNGKSVAYGLMAERNYFVVDGKKHEMHDWLFDINPVFSPDGRRFAFIARKGTKAFVVVDDEEHLPYQDIGQGSLVFSPDNRHFAYGAFSNGSWRMVVDGIEGRQVDVMDAGKFSPDSKHFAYRVKFGNNCFMIVDEKKHKNYDALLGDFVFSPDSKHFAYYARQGEECFLVLDGIEQKHYKGKPASEISFSPDSKHIAYGMNENDKEFVVFDEKELQRYDYIRAGCPEFSPDSRSIAYVASDDIHEFVVAAGCKSRSYDYILAEGDRRVMFDSDNSFHFVAYNNGSILLVRGTITNLKQDTVSPVDAQMRKRAVHEKETSSSALNWNMQTIGILILASLSALAAILLSRRRTRK
jgi:Tol biopolymer transport system component